MKNVVKGFWNYMRAHPDRSVNWCHLDRLRSSFSLWKNKFPEITPYYAIKSNPHKLVVETLASLGCNFDCASANEIKQVINMGHKNNNKKTDIIFANPFKMAGHLKYAENKGIHMMTADCPEEIIKIKKYHSSAKILLRIAVDDSHSVCKFNSKFGLVPEYHNLSRFFDVFQGKDMPEVVGLSFHVGSGCLSSDSYRDALEKSQYVFNFAKKQGIEMKILDLGGGFLPDEPLLTSVSSTIQTELAKWKQNNSPYPERIIAEPGRFFAKDVFDLYVRITGKKVEGTHTKLYINDSLYGSFNCKIFDHAKFDFEIYRQGNNDSQGLPLSISKNSSCHWPEPTYTTTIFGATCDSIDVIAEKIQLPKIEIGDYICYKNMGAYTLAASSKFNGVPPALVWTPPTN